MTLFRQVAPLEPAFQQTPGSIRGDGSENGVSDETPALSIETSSQSRRASFQFGMNFAQYGF